MKLSVTLDAVVRSSSPFKTFKCFKPELHLLEQAAMFPGFDRPATLALEKQRIVATLPPVARLERYINIVCLIIIGLCKQ